MPMNDTLQFEDFLLDVPPAQQAFVLHAHDMFLQQGYGFEIKPAKSGLVVSYKTPKEKKTIANYVFRKTGMFIRIYGQFVSQNEAMLNALPKQMRARIEKAATCKRLVDPTACSPTCPMGYTFELDGVLHKKCRYNCFLLPVTEESEPYLQSMLEYEVTARAKA